MMTYANDVWIRQKTVDQYIEDNKFIPINISFGKENAIEDGDIVFAIKYYINDKHQTLASSRDTKRPI